ncbi:MAG: trypsin-like peptidase domain-containing protein, partial [Rhodothermales bacterium]|nr:trypsin-like peptidase domain-containing protein [Rhodothermales bacterium]
EPALDGMLVARITRRFVFRADAEGVISIPTPKLYWAGRRQAPVASSVTAYRTTDSFHEVARGIVPIFVERKDAYRQRTFQRTGSGFFIRHDALVTSFHVVAEANRVHVLLPDGTRIESRDIWSVDPIRDVVVLHVDPNKVRAAGIVPLALAGGGLPPKSGDETVSEVVFTYGWPGGIRRSTAGRSFRSARLGYDRMWISSNGVRPGDSGGPLLNAAGEVIGVVTLGTTNDSSPETLQEDVCIANDPRPAIAQMSLALGTRSMKSMFRQKGFRNRPYVQAFRLMAMITRNEMFDEGLRDALSTFESAIAERRQDPGLHFMRGILYRMLGTDDEANASFTDVLQIFDGFFPASYLLGLDHLRKREFADAARRFEQTREVEPYRHLAEYGLARAHMGLHDYESAVDLLDRVLSYDPFFAPALFDISLCYLVLGRSAELKIASVRLGHISRRWQRQLQRVVDNSALQPIRVDELPRAVVRDDA